MSRRAPHDSFDRGVLEFSRRHDLLAPSATIVCAVSGGADSMAMLRFFHHHRARLGVDLEVAHLHHGIPAALSDDAAALVRRMAGDLGLLLHEATVDVPRLARSTGAGLEAAGREARLLFFRHVAAGRPSVRVATAHTVEDQAETVLLRLARGTGPDGLAAIRPRIRLRGERAGGREWPEATVIRPLLGIHRADARAYATAEGWALCEDPTNQDESIPRNRVRHALVPWLARELNPSVVAALGRLAAAASDDEIVLGPIVDDAWEAAVREESDGVVVSADLRSRPAAVRSRIWARALREAGAAVDAPTLLRLDDLLHGPSGRRVVASRLRARRERRAVVIDRVPPPPEGLREAAARMLAEALGEGSAEPRIPGPRPAPGGASGDPPGGEGIARAGTEAR